MAESKVSPYSVNDLKSTTDDALGNYLRGLSFKQDNSKLDIRLALGYVSVILAAALFAADYRLGWEATKQWTALAVAVYVVINGAFTYWMWAVEKGLVFEGKKDGHKVSFFSKVKKHDPTYFLTVTVTQSGTLTSSQQIEAPFMRWFTADGYFVAQPFQQWLATSVEAVGNADSKSAKTSGKDEALSSELETPLASPSNGNIPASGVDKGKGTKRSKRKG